MNSSRKGIIGSNEKFNRAFKIYRKETSFIDHLKINALVYVVSFVYAIILFVAFSLSVSDDKWVLVLAIFLTLGTIFFGRYVLKAPFPQEVPVIYKIYQDL